MHRTLPLLLLLTVFSAQALPLAKPPSSLNHSHLADTTRKSKKPSFYLQYEWYGNGVSVIIPRLPVLEIKGNHFDYSYFRGRGPKIETIRKGTFRQSSIDSILNLITSLADSTIKRINPFVMGGGTHLLTITNGTDTTKFRLINSFDYTAFKIVNIINQYLPQDDRIWYTEELLKQEKESREWFDALDEEKKKKDSIKAIPNGGL